MGYVWFHHPRRLGAESPDSSPPLHAYCNASLARPRPRDARRLQRPRLCSGRHDGGHQRHRPRRGRQRSPRCYRPGCPRALGDSLRRLHSDRRPVQPPQPARWWSLHGFRLLRRLHDDSDHRHHARTEREREDRRSAIVAERIDRRGRRRRPVERDHLLVQHRNRHQRLRGGDPAVADDHAEPDGLHASDAAVLAGRQRQRGRHVSRRHVQPVQQHPGRRRRAQRCLRPRELRYAGRLIGHAADLA